MSSCAAAKVVALLGVSGSGKSLVARRLLASGFARIRFSDPGRDMLTAGFGCSYHEVDGDDKEAAQRRFGGHSPQTLLQTLMYDWGRFGIHSDLWVNEWRRRVDAASALPEDKRPQFILTDDLHRPNEAIAVRDAGGIIVRVHRPDHQPPHASHHRQQARISADLELVNNGQGKLLAATDKLLEGLQEQRRVDAA